MLRSHRIPLGICSGALRSDIEHMLDGSELKGAFDVIVSANDVTKGKPDPQGFLLAHRRLGEKLGRPLQAGRCVVIEDSYWGLQAAGLAGMKRIAVTHTYPAEQLAPHAERVVNSIQQVTISDLEALCSE
jgi:beta-phosphoglucomutase